jgi:hypothetical protein
VADGVEYGSVVAQPISWLPPSFFAIVIKQELDNKEYQQSKYGTTNGKDDRANQE